MSFDFLGWFNRLSPLCERKQEICTNYERVLLYLYRYTLHKKIYFILRYHSYWIKHHTFNYDLHEVLHYAIRCGAYFPESVSKVGQLIAAIQRRIYTLPNMCDGVNGFSTLTIFAKRLHLRCLTRSKYTSGIYPNSKVFFRWI